MGQRPVAARLILFDFDGTLVDSQWTIVEAMGMAFAELGRKPPAAAAVRRVVGLSLERALQVLMDDEQSVDMTCLDPVALANRYRRAHLEVRTRPDHVEPLFPGVRALLRGLDRPERFLGIATGKSMAPLRHSLERHGLGHHFATLQTADRNPGKPSPEMVRRAMDLTGVEPAETVVVGDTVYDMQMARNAGVEALGVTWGYHHPDELSAAGAAHILGTPGDLDELISSRERDAT